MRDIVIFAIVGLALLKVFSKPYIGIYLWTWLSLMNPHRLTWGVAHDFPFAAVVGGSTLIGMFVSKEKGRMVWTREMALLLLFVGWMSITTAFAFHPDLALEYLVQVLKIQLFVFLTVYLISGKRQLIGLLWVTALSLAFYGVKGGLFTLISGGGARVMGPEGSFLGGNNELALALIMTVPLLVYLFQQEQRKWLRYGLGGVIFLCALAIVGSQSRGALVGAMAMGGFLWLKSRQKFKIGFIVLAAAVIILISMPESWWERMSTIRDYQQDSSALGRINAWWTAWNVATSNFFGGGFKMFTPDIFRLYAPVPDNPHDAHSIYFQVLGEHGFTGLFLFLALGISTWFRCGKIIRAFKNSDPQHKWMADLAAMLQVSLIGFAATGAFLGLAYFDYYYLLIAIIVILWGLSLRTKGMAKTRRAERHRY